MFIIKGLLFTPAKLREAFPEKHSTSIFRCWFFDVLEINTSLGGNGESRKILEEKLKYSNFWMMVVSIIRARANFYLELS